MLTQIMEPFTLLVKDPTGKTRGITCVNPDLSHVHIRVSVELKIPADTFELYRIDRPGLDNLGHLSKVILIKAQGRVSYLPESS